MRSHTNVVNGQNSSLGNELSSFISANEAMRIQLDRRAHIYEMAKRNEESIHVSAHEVCRSRSPVRRTAHIALAEPVHVPVPVAVVSPVHHGFSHNRSFSNLHHGYAGAGYAGSACAGGACAGGACAGGCAGSAFCGQARFTHTASTAATGCKNCAQGCRCPCCVPAQPESPAPATPARTEN